MIEIEGVALHVGVTGRGCDLVVLSGGPGCVQYLERGELAAPHHRAWFPEPRGVGRSGGGPHAMERAIADLERIRAAVGVHSWVVLGHSWGTDLAVRNAVEHPDAVTRVVGIAGCGPQRDRTWFEAWKAGRPSGPVVEVDWGPDVNAWLSESFTDWTHHPDLWRRLATTARCPTTFGPPTPRCGRPP